MGEEGATAEVAETVENGTVSTDKAANDVSEKKEAVEEMEKDVKEKKEGEGEEEKGNEEPESGPMEVDDKKAPDEETENKDTEAADSKEEEENNKEENQEEEDQEETPEEKRTKKGAKKKGGDEKSNSKTKASVEKKEKEPTTPAVPTIERPVRQRKSVERLVAVIERDSTKEFHILKGCGTALKDIPNVAYKLSKRKANDDTLKLLHTILFGRRGKALQVKSNILQFSGFVWPDNEEKHKLRVKEKLDKLNKEKLSEFCDIFDMTTVSRTNKEDIVVKLIDFMLTPHATTSELLAERKISRPQVKSVRGQARKAHLPLRLHLLKAHLSLKTKSVSEEAKKRVAETDDSEEEGGEEEKDNEEHEDVNGASEKSEDGKSEDVSSEEEHVSEPESEEESSKKRKRSSAKSKSSKNESGVKPKEKKKVVATPKKTSSSPEKKKPVKSSTSDSKAANQSDPGTKTFSRKNKKKDAVEDKPVTPKKPAPKEKSGKKTENEKGKPKSEKQKISDDDLRTAICEILKEVDFNTATFTDILKHLAKRFNTDLTSRKASIKFMIQEELTKLADEAEEEDEEEPEKTGKQASGQGVKA
ncbi:hypothetical protein HanRHA438_Chr03g0130921 [Helianthus annuus]|nr:hypothetical protein HanRHA438_Chr03g0130921 [Helianthus annuus]